MISFGLSYEGSNADDHEIDFYDVSRALIGFQRSLAITVHLVVNGEIITQAPSLKNARIFVRPPKEGSWKIIATVTAITAGAYQLGTAPKDSPIGNLVYSAYDYVLSHSLGFHADYDKTIGSQLEQLRREGKRVPFLTEAKLDSAIEKCHNAIVDMHRPIVGEKTASAAKINCIIGGDEEYLSTVLDEETFDYINETILDDKNSTYVGRVSMYNANTYKGRIYAFEASRPIPFILAESARSPSNEIMLADNLAENVRARFRGPTIEVVGKNLLSRKGKLKGVKIKVVNG